MLFYFTGTGNSLYAAKRIEKNPLSIPQVMQGTELDFSAEQIGIVAPIYGHEVPPMVKEFLRKAKFHTDYFYMVLTYGNRHGGAGLPVMRVVWHPAQLHQCADDGGQLAPQL